MITFPDKCTLLAIIFAIDGCSTLPQTIDQPDLKQTCIGSDEIFVISHGWHTGIAIKSTDITELMPELAERFPGSQYIEIGWGDAGFYQAKEITTELTLRAMFWSSGSVLHVVGFNENPAFHFPNSDVHVLSSNREGYQNLLQFIQSSFVTDSSGTIIKQRRGLYGNGQFYSGVGKYQLFNTCNKWTAKALSSAGYPLNPMFKLTASSVMNSLEFTCP